MTVIDSAWRCVHIRVREGLAAFRLLILSANWKSDKSDFQFMF